MLIIDGYNLIFTTGAEPDKSPGALEKLRNGLISKLKSYNHTRKEQIIVVFDGESGLPYPERKREDIQLEVIFSQSGVKADDIILNLITAAGKPKSIEAVTSDRELADAARRAGARICPCAEFLQRLDRPARISLREDIAEPVEKVIGLTPDETRAWMKIFGDKTNH